MTAAIHRVVAVAVLLLALALLAVWMGTLQPDPSVGDYPGTIKLVDDYDRYLGQHVAVGGLVTATDPVTIVNEDGAGGTLRLTVTDLDVQPTVDDSLRVYGVVQRENTVRAESAFAVPLSGRTYTYAVSFLAGLWVLGRLVRHWRLGEGLALERRTEPLSLRTLARRPTSREETDA